MDDIVVVVSNTNQNVDPITTIDAIKEAGFKEVFVQWYNRDWEVSQEEQMQHIKDIGLNVKMAHLGYDGISNLWVEGPLGDSLVTRYKKDFDTCKKMGISLVFMHLEGGFDAEPYNEIGLARLREMASYAEQVGIKVAFENVHKKGYLDYVIENIKSDNIGICFDIGHFHAYFKDDFDFSKFKDKIFAVHLHDNDASSDQHLIPFEGTINWDEIITKLVACNYNGPVIMELCYRNKYLEMPIVDFYKKGYCTGEKLKEMFNNKRNI